MKTIKAATLYDSEQEAFKAGAVTFEEMEAAYCYELLEVIRTMPLHHALDTFAEAVQAYSTEEEQQAAQTLLAKVKSGEVQFYGYDYMKLTEQLIHATDQMKEVTVPYQRELPEHTQEEFDSLLLAVADSKSVEHLLNIPGVYLLVAEYMKNDVYDILWEDREVAKAA